MTMELNKIGAWTRWFSPAFVAIAMAASQLAARMVPAPITGQIATVTDGDTFRLTSGERIRIADVDAPESQRGQARCALELERGHDATARVRPMLAGRTVSFVRVGKSYKRTVARVRIDGRDLGERLNSLGITRPWPRRMPKPDWCR